MAADGAILVIDDESAVRRFLCAALEETGLEVVGAGGGAEARRVCAASGEPIRFVLLDLVGSLLGLGFGRATRA